MWRILMLRTSPIHQGIALISVYQPHPFETALDFADTYNREEGMKGRYFVVSEEEYQSYWKGIVS